MNKLILISAMALFSSLANAKSIGTAGCGLGNLVFGAKPGMIQIVAATLNGTGGQVFAITTGTSNCGGGFSSAQLEQFVEANQIALANEMSRGNGDTVAGIQKILGCQDSQSMTQALKENYEVIFPKADVKAKDVSKQIRQVLKTNSVTCSQLG